MVIRQKEESVRYQVKSNDNFFVRWTEETDDTSQWNIMTYEVIQIFIMNIIQTHQEFLREKYQSLTLILKNFKRPIGMYKIIRLVAVPQIITIDTA